MAAVDYYGTDDDQPLLTLAALGAALEGKARAGQTEDPISQGQSFVILCEGHEGQATHIEYRFRVRHCGGCEWTVLRRYFDLNNLHERLCADFGAGGLPHFPPKQAPIVAISSFFGFSPGSRDDVVSEREIAFQKYFDELCGREDVVKTQIFQAALGVVEPEPVACLRVRSWLLGDSKGERALLDVRADPTKGLDSGAVAEVFHIVATWGWNDPNSDTKNELIVADMEISATAASSSTNGYPDAGAVIDGLPAGAQVELEAQAINAVGRSAKVSIRVLVPRGGSGSSPSSPAGAESGGREAATEAAVCESSSSSQACAAPPVNMAGASQDELVSWMCSQEDVQDPESVLEQRRLHLEQQCLQLEQRKDEAEKEDAERQRQKLEFVAQREALEREREDFENNRRCSSTQSLASPTESFTGDASPRGSGELGHEALAALLSEVEKQKSELEKQRQEQTSASQRAALEASHLAEEVQAQQAELERRTDELHRVEADREAAIERSEEAQRHAREELLREREELERLLRVQTESVAAAEAGGATKAAVMDEQQAEELRKQEISLHRKAAHLARTEEILSAERVELQRSRANLAMVKAHVMSMLDKAESNPETKNHRLDGDVLENASDVSSDDQATPLSAGVVDVRVLPSTGSFKTLSPEDLKDAPEEAVPGMSDSCQSVDQVWSMDWSSPLPAAEPEA